MEYYRIWLAGLSALHTPELQRKLMVKVANIAQQRRERGKNGGSLLPSRDGEERGSQPGGREGCPRGLRNIGLPVPGEVLEFLKVGHLLTFSVHLEGLEFLVLFSQ